MSQLVEYLRNGGTLAGLKNELGINNTRHKLYPNLVLFKYNQIESPTCHPLVKEARGIILDEEDNWAVVSRPFDRFLNYGQEGADEIDWASARILEKLDGSLATIYFYDDRWHIATSGTPDAGGNVNGFEMTFEDLFWKTFKAQGLVEPGEEYEDYSFVFELTTPYNRVVVPHKESRVTLLTVRNRVTGHEVRIHHDEEDFIKPLNFPVVRSYNFNTVEDVLSSLTDVEGLEFEGYVIVDKNHHRIKVKNAKYVAIHHLKDGFSKKRVLEIVRNGEKTEFLTYFPEWTGVFNEIKQRYDSYVAELKANWEKYKHIEGAKEFALAIKQTANPHPLFALKQGRTESIEQFLVGMQIRHLMEYLKIQDVDLATEE